MIRNSPPRAPVRGGKKILLIVVAAIVAILSIATAFHFDAPVRSGILESQGKGWKNTSDYQIWASVSQYGDWPQLMLFGGAGWLLACAIRRKDWKQVIVAALIASTLTGILANTSRLTTGRVRPRDEAKQGAGFHGPWHNGAITIGNSKYNAFPSGHTATAMGFAAPFLYAKPLVGIPVLLAAVAIAWSRMALGAHHLSDVITSTILALVVGWFVLWWVREKGSDSWARLVSWFRAFLEK